MPPDPRRKLAPSALPPAFPVGTSTSKLIDSPEGLNNEFSPKFSMIVSLLESGCCSCNILESCLQRNEIRSGKKSIMC